MKVSARNTLTQIALILGLSLFAFPAMATFEEFMCELGVIMQEYEPLFSTLIVIEMGVLAMLSRLTWNTALLHIVGMGVVIGAQGIVTIVAGPDAVCI